MGPAELEGLGLKRGWGGFSLREGKSGEDGRSRLSIGGAESPREGIDYLRSNFNP
jgi:hypothetical protein